MKLGFAKSKHRRNARARAGAFRNTEQTFHCLLRNFGLLRQVMEPSFARRGVSAAQWGVMRVLQRAEKAGEPELRLSDLSERLLIQPPSVTGVVDRLERGGLVKRRESRTDQRVRKIRLTPRGRKLMATVMEGHRAKVQSLFAQHGAREMRTLFLLLKKLETHLTSLAQLENSNLNSKSLKD